ncbi:MAG: response regulator transcription factor [Leptolyngbya sp.]|nr:response regulator transcription factor [Candidatus Melainabacteria bacterium]
MARILVVEDEKDLSKLIADWLRRDHHLIEQAYDGASALAQMKSTSFDVVVLDLMLPELSGIEVCKRYRQAGGNAAVIMLTARHSLEDKAAGFESGADDYLTKPFQLKELAMRVKALLRRSSVEHHTTLSIRDIELDIENHRVLKGGKEVHLLPKEFRLLEFLLRHPQRVFSADEILDSVWEMDTGAHHDTVRGHVTRLRKKLDGEGEQSVIVTVHGVGYKLGLDDA